MVLLYIYKSGNGDEWHLHKMLIRVSSPVRRAVLSKFSFSISFQAVRPKELVVGSLDIPNIFIILKSDDLTPQGRRDIYFCYSNQGVAFSRFRKVIPYTYLYWTLISFVRG